MMVAVYMFLYMRHEQLSSLFYDGDRLYVLIHETRAAIVIIL